MNSNGDWWLGDRPLLGPGRRPPSDAALAMELGADAVLVNTAIPLAHGLVPHSIQAEPEGIPAEEQTEPVRGRAKAGCQSRAYGRAKATLLGAAK